LESGFQLLAGARVRRGADDLAGRGIKRNRIASRQNLLRSQEAQAGFEGVATMPQVLDLVSDLLVQSLSALVQKLAALAQNLARPESAQALAETVGGDLEVLDG
jgi:hypothetical protein